MATTEAHLKQTLRSDLTNAIRDRDELRTATLRMVLTAVQVAEVAGTSARELSDEEVLGVLRAEAKKRREAAEAFGQAGRSQSAERERAEEQVIAGYLPAQMDDDALAAIVAEEVARAAESGRSGPAAMGAVMAGVRPRVGQQAEGGRIAAEVKRQLSRA